jgi:molybdopterin-guanine dinucleotide biosynthesis protein A
MSADGLVRAGFVLVGGLSTRMGRDKALLPVSGSTLVEQVARRVRRVAGTVTLVGPPERYRSLGFPVIADRVTGCGPLGGVYTALSSTSAQWNLVVACDMPEVSENLMEDLFRTAETAAADCVVPQTAQGLDPLCAVYHRRCSAAAKAAIDRKILKMHDFVSILHGVAWPVSDHSLLANVNTPEDWGVR